MDKMSKLLQLLLVASVMTSSALMAAEAPAPQERFERALALHDSGDYDGAIAIYRQLLTTNPGNAQVEYELTFSTFAKGDMGETVRLATEGARKAGPSQVRYLELLGNAYDNLNRTRDAIDAYRRGIKIEPGYARIRFNLGVAYLRQGKLRDGRGEFERAIELDPSYASPQFAMANLYRDDGYRVPAILAYGRFLSLEREGQRAMAAAKSLHELINFGVKSEGQGNVNITIDPKPKKDLGDFSGLEMMAALAAGASHLPENQQLNEFDREADTLSMFMTMLAEAAADYRRGFVAKTYVPFYSALVKAGQSVAFAHIALSPLRLDGTDEWLTVHTADVTAFDAWLRGTSAK
jgi:tetratricopeptide (TPR) repeat protein